MKNLVFFIVAAVLGLAFNAQAFSNVAANLPDTSHSESSHYYPDNYTAKTTFNGGVWISTGSGTQWFRLETAGEIGISAALYPLLLRVIGANKEIYL